MNKKPNDDLTLKFKTFGKILKVTYQYFFITKQNIILFIKKKFEVIKKNKLINLIIKKKLIKELKNV